MQIVNVDDDQDDREMFCISLEMIDMEIDCVQFDSGEKAVRSLSDQKFSADYIFMDINMPRMNGYECVKELLELPHLRNTGIIMFSSTFNPRDQVDFGVLGLKYLLKTSNIPSLAESIRKLIQP